MMLNPQFSADFVLLRPHPHEVKTLNSFQNYRHKDEGVSENVCVYMNALDTHEDAVKHLPDL